MSTDTTTEPTAPAFVDPRERFARPPYDQQNTDLEPTGATEQMNPKPDHGEQSYVGSGKLAGRVAIITGADSGIGRATAIAYAREGAKVVIGYFNHAEDADETLRWVQEAGEADGCDAEGITIQADLRDESACERLIDRAVERFGRLNLLVNNAAYQQTRASIEATETELFDRIMKTNVYGTFWLSKAAMRIMHPGDSIINTASIQSIDPSGMLLPYATSKSAIAGMTKALAKLAMDSHGVRVNAVAPGPVWTPLIPSTMPADAVEHFGASTALGRPAMPAELAPLYVWLASADASYVTGEMYGATGGKTPL
jgi:NAD(P)-dependent dehydrogenase (short-subunit alcohol dehydrogenase family)